MKKHRIFISLFITATIFLVSCSTVPLTGRRQLDLIPNETMLSMSFQEYNDFLKTAKLSNNLVQTRMVGTVGKKIQNAVEQYFAEQKMLDEIKDYKWEFNLVESEEVNAWCMPGGKVVVYTGILPITKDVPGLAVVMGHEIAHAIARHGNERMSQGLLAELGGMALSVALENKPEQTKQLWMTAFGVGAQLGVLLPYSRLHESEADRLGLIFVSMAGYDPNYAVDFWQRMAQMGSGKGVPEFLSTHPSDETRIQKIKGWLPEAMKYYQKAR